MDRRWSCRHWQRGKRLADELGYGCPEVVEEGLSEEEKRALARALNLARRQQTQEQKRAVIGDQLQETPRRSNRWIARRLGVSHHTVQAVRDALSSGGQIAHLEFVEGEDGKQYPAAPAGRNLGRSDAGRVPLDYYGTPVPAIEPLLERAVSRHGLGAGLRRWAGRAHGWRRRRK